MQQRAARAKEVYSGDVDELGAVICLKAFEGKAELGMHVVSKGDNISMNLRFLFHGKSPNEVTKIIRNH